MNCKIWRVSFLFLLGGCFSCVETVTKEKELTNMQRVQAYYQALNNHHIKAVNSHIADSMTQISGSYKESWSRSSFANWLAWDASFSPVYVVYDILELTENKVQLTISKNCKRIQYLNEEPTKYTEIFHFKDNQIRTIEAGEYLVFNDSLWIAKRDTLVAFTQRNHPELNGFIHDQTKKGSSNYLKALRFYREAHQTK